MQQIRLFRLSRLASWLWAVFFYLTAIAVLVPLSPDMPIGGLDPSWMMSMNQAMSQSLIIGEEIIFTFGPYASIYTRAYHPATDGLMIWGSMYVALSFAYLSLLSFKQSKRGYVSLIYVVLVGLVYLLDIFVYYYILLVGNYYLNNSITNPSSFNKKADAALVLLVIMTPLGFFPLIKGSFIIVCGAVTGVIVLLFLSRRRYAMAATAIFIPAVSLCLFWVIANQPMGSLPNYFISMLPIISGYTEGMAISGSNREIVLYALGSIFLLFVLSQNKSGDKYEKILQILLISMLLFMSFKAAFVRHDGPHAVAYTTILALATLTLAAAQNSIKYTLAAAFSSVIFVIAVLTNQKQALPSIPLKIAFTYSNLMSGVHSRLFDQVQLNHGYKSALKNLESAVNLPKLNGTVDIYSYDQSYLIASGNTWNPRPIFQSYSVYTPELAEINKLHLLGNNRPDNIVFSVQPIDNRLPSLEDGASWPVILEKYSPLALTSNYLSLNISKFAADLTEVVLVKQNYSFSEEIQIPDVNQLVFARIYVKPTTFGRLAKFLFKTSPLDMQVRLKDGSVRNFRVIADMMRSDFLVSPLVEDTADFLSAYGGNDYLIHKKVQSIAINAKFWPWLWGDRFEVEFISFNIQKQLDAVNRLVDPKDFIPSLPVTQKKYVVKDSKRCDGSIDVINGVLATTPGIAVKDFVRLNGWMAISAEGELLPREVYISIVDVDGKQFLIKTNRSTRPDVATYFKKPLMKESGYTAYANVSELKGVSKVGLAFSDENGLIRRCPEFNIPVAFN